MMTLDSLITYVKGLLPVGMQDYEIVPGSDMPDTPEPSAKFQRLEGTGLSVEQLFDGMGFQVEVQGKQNDYASAEALAYAIDAALIGNGGSRSIGGKWVLSAQRFSGGPTDLEVDDAERHHLVATYVLDVQSGYGG